MISAAVISQLNLREGTIQGAPATHRRLGDLKGAFVDSRAYEAAMAVSNALLYTVSVVEPAGGEGQLHYALGRLMPGRIGREYYFTKGHCHRWRAAAEVYAGFGGEGCLLLQDEGGESRIMPLAAGTVVYVPGCTAHRTINTGSAPLVYLGVYPADAGQDYAALAEHNFSHVVVEAEGRPVMIRRTDYQP